MLCLGACPDMCLRRLKVLKEEIRKPYFIKLKEFLWKEGVKGPSDSSPSLKIYPARKTPLLRASADESFPRS